MKVGKQHTIYGDALFEHKPTLRFLVWHYFYNKFINLERHKQAIYREKTYFLDKSITLEGIKVTYLAVIVDAKVAEVIKMRSETANLLKAISPQFVEFDPKTIDVKIGMEYNGEFIDEQKD